MIFLLLGIIIGVVLGIYVKNEIAYFYFKRYQKFESYFNTLDKLLQGIENDNILYFFGKDSIKKIAIYGYGKIGRHLERYLSNYNYEIIFFDKNKNDISKKIYSLNSQFPEIDLVIIAVPNEEKSIKNTLEGLGINNIYSISEIVNGK